RRGQPALALQPVVAVFRQLRDAAACEQLRRGAVARGFRGHGLGAVLAELEGRSVVAVGPGAAGAVEAVGLVGAQQRLRAGDAHVFLHQLPRDALQRVPAAGGAVVPANRAAAAHARSLPPLPAAGSGSSRRPWLYTAWPS